MAEAAIYLAAEMFAEDELMNYPRSFRLEVGADNLVNIFEVYAGSGPEPPLIAHHVVVDTELVPLLANINDLTVHHKRVGTNRKLRKGLCGQV